MALVCHCEAVSDRAVKRAIAVAHDRSTTSPATPRPAAVVGGATRRSRSSSGDTPGSSLVETSPKPSEEHPMQGDPRTIELLNDVLTGELTAINQYFIHGKMCANWGYERLAEHIVHESIDEMKHADRVIERILFFDGVPNLQRLHSVQVGETVPEQFALDLEVEYVAVKRLNDAHRVVRGGRRQHHPGAPRGDPRLRGGAHRLARDPARDHPPDRRGELSRAAGAFLRHRGHPPRGATWSRRVTLHAGVRVDARRGLRAAPGDRP